MAICNRFGLHVLSRVFIILFALFFVVAVVQAYGVPEVLAKSCKRNSDCKDNNQKCQQGQCVPKNNSAGNGNGNGRENSSETREGNDDGYSGAGQVTQAITNPGVDCITPGKKEGAKTELGCIPKDPYGFAQEYYTLGLSLIGGTAILFLMIGGYIMLTSQGNPLRLRNGKTYIFYAIFGLLLAIFGYVFIRVVIVNILRVPGFA